MAVKIVADSTCDLEEEQLQQYGITVLPLNIVMGETSYQDKENIYPDEIYKWSEEHKTTPKTSATQMGEIEKRLRPVVETGEDVIFIGISEKMSVMCQSVRLVAEEMGWKQVFVIDSMNLSTGIGLQVLKAAQLAQQGIKANEIVQRINESRSLVRASFVVDTLTYLHRGGRCNAVAFLIGSTLKLKPMIEVKDGAMGVGRKYRGLQQKVVSKYVEDLKEELINAEPERVFITHSGIEQSVIDDVRGQLQRMNYFQDIIVTRAGGVVSSHCGPKTLGVLFYIKK